MKKMILTILLAVLISALSFAEKGMVVTQKIAGLSGNMQVSTTWYVTQHDCKMKMDFSDGTVKSANWFIPDSKNGKLLMYTEGAVPAGAQKSFYSIPVHDIDPSKSMNPSRVKVERTGQTKTIGAVPCEKIIARTNKTITEMWVSQSFQPAFYSFYAFFQDSYELMALSEERIPGFPLSSTTTDMSGKIISSSEFVSAAFSELADSDFKVPAEYKSVEEIAGKK
jgi:hypothetical protein